MGCTQVLNPFQVYASWSLYLVTIELKSTVCGLRASTDPSGNSQFESWRAASSPSAKPSLSALPLKGERRDFNSLIYALLSCINWLSLTWLWCKEVHFLWCNISWDHCHLLQYPQSGEDTVVTLVRASFPQREVRGEKEETQNCPHPWNGTS